ncbi:hypothetical protein PENSPDRAFT_694599 [Peniophora sp. CONT]|nr:hypothetical protein PENSPDRAFT_694599 [Peniophora sp. CONT]
MAFTPSPFKSESSAGSSIKDKFSHLKNILSGLPYLTSYTGNPDNEFEVIPLCIYSPHSCFSNSDIICGPSEPGPFPTAIVKFSDFAPYLEMHQFPNIYCFCRKITKFYTPYSDAAHDVNRSRPCVMCPDFVSGKNVLDPGAPGCSFFTQDGPQAVDPTKSTPIRFVRARLHDVDDGPSEVMQVFNKWQESEGLGASQDERTFWASPSSTSTAHVKSQLFTFKGVSDVLDSDNEEPLPTQLTSPFQGRDEYIGDFARFIRPLPEELQGKCRSQVSLLSQSEMMHFIGLFISEGINFAQAMRLFDNCGSCGKIFASPVLPMHVCMPTALAPTSSPFKFFHEKPALKRKHSDDSEIVDTFASRKVKKLVKLGPTCTSADKLRAIKATAHSSSSRCVARPSAPHISDARPTAKGKAPVEVSPSTKWKQTMNAEGNEVLEIESD